MIRKQAQSRTARSSLGALSSATSATCSTNTPNTFYPLATETVHTPPGMQVNKETRGSASSASLLENEQMADT